jgi:hypothetical protein
VLLICLSILFSYLFCFNKCICRFRYFFSTQIFTRVQFETERGEFAEAVERIHKGARIKQRNIGEGRLVSGEFEQRGAQNESAIFEARKRGCLQRRKTIRSRVQANRVITFYFIADTGRRICLN